MLFGKVIKTEAELLELLQPSSVLFDGRSDVRLLISVKEPSDVLAMFKHHLRLVYAGGGIVFNEHNQILLIKRNGYWDLPKGKMDERVCQKRLLFWSLETLLRSSLHKTWRFAHLIQVLACQSRC